MSGNDTIFALSSGALPAGLAIVRLSGSRVEQAAAVLCGGLPSPRRALLKPIRNRFGEILDQGMVLYFPGPASFTGEDVLELHLHGSKAVAAEILRELASFDGLRSAEAGEFSRRAFLNGKKDLASIEGLADLIAAETEAQRRFAIGNSAGVQARLYASWRERILVMRSLLEAELDFGDEEDIAGSVSDIAWLDATALESEINEHLAGFRRAEIVLEGYRIVLAGAPNAGKSSLLNALARRDAALVSDEAGTTRDLIDVLLDLGGMKVVLTDTAGIRTGGGRIEQMGMERAFHRMNDADLVVELLDLSNPVDIGLMAGVSVLRIGSKADVAIADAPECEIRVSIVDPASISELLGLMETRAKAAGLRNDEIAPSKARHVELLLKCTGELREAIRHGGGLELRAEHLRRSAEWLGRIAGDSDVEDMLDVIFSRFCIGK